ncbi:MAG: cation diffusion facilitator family transporter [Clostridium sp.]|uniref:cation diffusion facilitator family transporter n=1 Tax=Clostridium sp. TaxID=1506 RepID=UPI002FCA248A
MTKKSAALLSIVSNTFLIIFKVVAGVLMGSISVLSEAIHSSLDLVASVIAYISIRKSLEPSDKEHPYGHGKFENVSGFIEALLIFIAAGIIIYEAINKMFKSIDVNNIYVGMIVMLISAGVNFVISMILFKISKREESIALEADAMHLLTDVFTSIGVCVGLLLLKLTGIQIIDPIVAILVALLIIKASIDLTKRSLIDLVDTSLPSEEIHVIESLIDANPDITSHHNLRTRKSGKNREIDFHIKVNPSLSVVDAHVISHDIKKSIEDTLPNSNIIVHIEPYKFNKMT